MTNFSPVVVYLKGREAVLGRRHALSDDVVIAAEQAAAHHGGRRRAARWCALVLVELIGDAVTVERDGSIVEPERADSTREAAS